MRRALAAAILFLGISGAYLLGWLAPIDRGIRDLGFRLFPREATGEIVLVAIDPKSLSELPVWPWPRENHGKLVDKLLDAGASRIALDIDFSSASNPDSDKRLAEALRRGGKKIALPVFRQPSVTRDGKPTIYHSQPHTLFRGQATLATVNVWPGEDGKVRRAFASDFVEERELPALSALIAGRETPPSYFIDFSIQPDSVPVIPYIDVLQGRFEKSEIKGKVVMVGATAVELGDNLPVPVWQSMPGALLQIVSAQSVLQNRALQNVSPLIVVALLGGMLVACLAHYERWSFGIGAATAATLTIGLPAIALALQTSRPVLLDTSPLLIGNLLAFAYAFAMRMRRQDIQLVAQGLALFRRNAMTRLIVDHSFDAILTIDDSDRIRSANPRAAALFGVPSESLLGRPAGKWIALDEGSGSLHRSSAVLLPATGQRGDGTRFEAELSVGAYRLDREDGAVLVLRDISDRRAAERKAEGAEAELRRALESVEEAYALFDSEDRLVLANSHARNWLGLRHNGEAPRYRDLIERLVAEQCIVAARGRERDWLDAHAASNQGRFQAEIEGGIWLLINEIRNGNGRVLIAAEITDLKLRERDLLAARDTAELANRSKSEFLANMSHELRTPLNAIIGFSELIQSETFGPVGAAPYKEYIGDIRSSGMHLLEVINDILDISRLEAGKFTLRESEVHLAETIGAAVRIIKPKAEEAGISLTTEIDGDLPLIVGDDSCLKRIAINLLSNAVKFTEGGGRVRVRVTGASDGGVLLEVADNGIGIAKDQIDRLMTPFTQLDAGLDRRREGTGLGLSIVKSLVTLHGGAVSIDSQLGQGTRVCVSLPQDRVLRPAKRRAG